MIFSHAPQVMRNAFGLCRSTRKIYFFLHKIYLGFLQNSGDKAISLFDIKKEKINLLCSEILKDSSQATGTAAKLLRKFTNSFRVLWYDKLYCRFLGRDKIQALNLKREKFNNKMEVSSTRKEVILWWNENISTVFIFYFIGEL